jgi:glycosyltransferase involved in cell wall biosynthesis
MTILHIPSWFPNNNNSIHGIFIKKQIEAISDFDANQHIVLIWHNTTTFSFKKPFTFLKRFFKAYEKPVFNTKGNIVYVEFNYLLSYYTFLGDNNKRLIKRTLRVFRRINKNYKIDLIHSHVTYPGGFIAHQINTKTNKPYIISEHMGPFPFESFISSLKEKIIEPVQNAKRVIAVSNFQSGEIKSYCKITPVIIPNLVDEREFFITANEVNSNVFCFLLVGHLSPIKGIDLLLKAAQLLKESGVSEFKIKIGGNGNILSSLQNLAKELNIEKHVGWLGE